MYFGQIHIYDNFFQIYNCNLHNECVGFPPLLVRSCYCNWAWNWYSNNYDYVINVSRHLFGNQNSDLLRNWCTWTLETSKVLLKIRKTFVVDGHLFTCNRLWCSCHAAWSSRLSDGPAFKIVTGPGLQGCQNWMQLSNKVVFSPSSFVAITIWLFMQSCKKQEYNCMICTQLWPVNIFPGVLSKWMKSIVSHWHTVWGWPAMW